MSLHWAQFCQKTLPPTTRWDPMGFFFTADALLLVVPCSWGTSKVRSSLFIMISAISPHKEFFSMHVLVLLALSSEWCLIRTTCKSFSIHRMHRKGCFKPKKSVRGGFSVCFQSKNNEFQKRGRRRTRGESHRTKLGKWREKGKKSSLLSEQGFWPGSSNSSRKQNSHQVILELVWLVQL